MVTTEPKIKRIDVPELVNWFEESEWTPDSGVYVYEPTRSCCLLGGIWLRDHASKGNEYEGGALPYVSSLGFDPAYLQGIEHGFMGYEADEDDDFPYRIGIEDGRTARAELISD